MPKTPENQLPPYGPAHKRRRTGKDRPAAAPRTRQGDRTSADEDEDGKPRKYLTGPQVCARYAVSDMTLWRWLQDATLGFPSPTFVVRQRRFWDEAVLRDWEIKRIAALPVRQYKTTPPEAA
jgi:predicted DNA-binding transcriptional regulator AlpA